MKDCPASCGVWTDDVTLASVSVLTCKISGDAGVITYQGKQQEGPVSSPRIVLGTGPGVQSMFDNVAFELLD